MNDDNDIKKFLEGKVDFGVTPAEYPLTDEQRKLAAFGMAFNAAVIQFILEGVIPEDQQLHFIGHLQDFVNRLYKGESLTFPGVPQTLQLNSKSGNLFYEAAERALVEGSKAFDQIKEFTKLMNEDREQTNKVPDPDASIVKPTLH